MSGRDELFTTRIAGEPEEPGSPIPPDPRKIAATLGRINRTERRAVVRYGAKLLIEQHPTLRSREAIRAQAAMLAPVWGEQIVEDITDEACRRLRVQLEGMRGGPPVAWRPEGAKR